MPEDLAYLNKLRASLLAEAVGTDQRVQKLQNELAKEQADVAKLREGVLGFLQSLAMTDELKQEQREATEAAARLREGLAARDALYAKLDEVDRRIAAFDPVQQAREQAAQQAQAEVSALAKGSVSEQLMELSVRIEAIDMELGPLTEAVRAGSDAAGELIEILQAIGEAHAEPVRAPMLQERTARAMAGDAHAKLLVFLATLEALPAPDDTSPRFADLVAFEDRVSFVDDVVHRLLAPGVPVQTRLAEARDAVHGRMDRLRAILDPVRARHAEVSQRRLAFEHQRSRVRAASGL